MFAQARLGELREEVTARVEEEDFEAAAALKKELGEVAEKLAELEAAGGETPETKIARAVRCLQLARLLLQEPSLALDGHEIAPLSSRFLPALQSPQVELRELAVKCLGLHCHGDASAAASFFNLLLKTVHHDQPSVQLASLRAIFDLLLLHSPAKVLGVKDELADPAAAEDAAALELGSLFLPILAQPASELRTATALGLCKLFHAGAIKSDLLLSRLLLTYFEIADGGATSEADLSLSQTLAVFFASAQPGSGGAALGRALMPAVRSVLAADSGAAEAEVPLDRLMTFVLALARPDEEASSSSAAAAAQPGASHVELAISICCETLLQPEGREGKVLPKALPHIVLPPVANPAVEILKSLLDELGAVLTDKVSLKHVQKLGERAAELLAKNARASPADEEGEVAPELPTAAEMVEAYEASREADLKRAAERVVRRDADEPTSRRNRESVSSEGSDGKGGRRKLGKAKPCATPTRDRLMSENAALNVM